MDWWMKIACLQCQQLVCISTFGEWGISKLWRLDYELDIWASKSRRLLSSTGRIGHNVEKNIIMNMFSIQNDDSLDIKPMTPLDQNSTHWIVSDNLSSPRHQCHIHLG